MTTDRDFDLIASSWLAAGPDQLPDRVVDAVVEEIHVTRQRRARRAPRRFPKMTSSMRLGAAALVGVLVVAGAFLFTRPGQPVVGAPSAIPSAIPTASPIASASASGLVETFTSPRYGYAIHYPSGWTATPATKQWLAGMDTLWGDPTLDTIGTSDARLAIASQPLAGTLYFDRQLRQGQTADDWLLARCGATGSTAAACGPRILIGGQPGWLDEDGAPASGGTVATGGVMYDAAVVYKDRGYEFTLDGKVDRALFDALLASVMFDADSAIDLPPLTKTFTSPTYGYTIGIGEGFRTTAATSKWTPDAYTGETPQDVIGTTKDDWFVTVASTAIPAGTTFDEWLVIHFPPIAAGGELCARSDPSTWPPFQIGNQVGRLITHCHGIDAIVGVGERAYIFTWGYQITDTNHTLADWKELLKSVTFDPAAAKD